MRRGGEDRSGGGAARDSEEVEIRIVAAGPAVPAAAMERRPSWHGRRHRQELGAAAAGRPCIALQERAFAAVHRQAAGSDDEVGGLLLGEAGTWRGALHVAVRAALAAEMTRSGPAHLTFTIESWAHLLARKEREHPRLIVVGWYHSHPRMGIFLSSLDLAIHHGFFSQPWHVALVVNGQDRQAGFFAWDGAEVRPAEHLIWLPAPVRSRAFVLAAERGRLAYRLHPAGRRRPRGRGAP